VEHVIFIDSAAGELEVGKQELGDVTKTMQNHIDFLVNQYFG
jgi:hypothetical protein